MLHDGCSNSNDGLLHGDSEHPMHIDREVLDGALRNPCQGVFNDRVRGEDGEVRFGNDFELHPRHLAEDHGELLVGLEVDNDATSRDAEVRAKVEARGHILQLEAIILRGCGDFHDEEESFEAEGLACFAKASSAPLELSIYDADVQIEVDAGVGHTSVGADEVKVEEGVFEQEVGPGVLDQILLTLAGRQRVD